MRHHVAAGILVVLFARIPASPAPQETPLERYQAIVDEYRSGSPDRAIASMRSWSESNRRSLEETVAAVARLPWRTQIEGHRVLLASAMLHSDTAVNRTGEAPALDFHLQLADHLLQSADRMKGVAFRPRWLLAMGLYLMDQAQIDTARPVLARACDTFPSDARLQLACGMVTATHGTLLRFIAPTEEEIRLGSDPAVEELAVRRRAPALQRQLLARRDASLTAAAGHFQKAIDMDPSLSEARLRLAHIHTMTGNDRLAQPMLSALTATAVPSELTYTVKLLLGGIAERRGNLQAAAELVPARPPVVPAGTERGRRAPVRVVCGR